jgi:hypothetical protein
MRRRGETIERSFAHLYDTGGMRRTHLRGHTNILKRLLIHAGGFNLGLLLRAIFGVGTPRGLQDVAGRALAALLRVIQLVLDFQTDTVAHWWLIPELRDYHDVFSLSPSVPTGIVTSTTGC